MTLDSCPIRNLANLSLERLDSRRSSRKQFWHQPWPSSLCLAETKRAEQSLVFRAVELNMGALAPSNNIINFAVNERTYWTHLSLAFLAQAQSLILLPSLYFQRILPLSEIERTSLDFNFVKPCLVMWQFDSTIGLMDWEKVLSCLQEVLSRSDISNHVKTFPVLHVSS